MKKAIINILTIAKLSIIIIRFSFNVLDFILIEINHNFLFNLIINSNNQEFFYYFKFNIIKNFFIKLILISCWI